MLFRRYIIGQTNLSYLDKKLPNEVNVSLNLSKLMLHLSVRFNTELF